jgi:hypothetical protein
MLCNYAQQTSCLHGRACTGVWSFARKSDVEPCCKIGGSALTDKAGLEMLKTAELGDSARQVAHTIIFLSLYPLLELFLLPAVCCPLP